jgi:hypothetical protein
MESTNLKKAALLTLVLVLVATAGWEMYLRNKGMWISYDDNEGLWSDKRSKVYKSSNDATVFIGSSRIKYDLDIPTWEKITGDEAIQLAMVGSNPRPVLENLADDKKFHGKLVIDVTEGLFFSREGGRSTPDKNIGYYKKITPAQRFSFQVNHVLESHLVFLDKNYFSLNSLLGAIPVHERPEVYGGPNFPQDFGKVSFERQTLMTDKFVADTNLQNQVKSIWGEFRKRSKDVPVTGAALDSIINSVKSCTDRIIARGGKIIFVRTPSSGPYLAGERMGFPREKYWDKLLSVTKCPGIHFEDYPAIAHFVCPEWSHLAPKDAIVFTKNFISILEEKGWTFPKKSTSL